MFTETRSHKTNDHRHPSVRLEDERETVVSEIGPVSREEFQALIGNGVSLINFNAAWCSPCRDQEPVVDALTRAYAGRATVVRINIDQNQVIAMALGIQSIPTTLLFKEGRELNRFIGFQTMETLDQVLEDALA